LFALSLIALLISSASFQLRVKDLERVVDVLTEKLETTMGIVDKLTDGIVRLADDARQLQKQVEEYEEIHISSETLDVDFDSVSNVLSAKCGATTSRL
jgi:hypothetical protein